MTASTPAQRSAMLAAAESEWRAHAPEDWAEINFWRWPRGFHRSAWVIAGCIGWNPLEVLDATASAARGVNALLTRQCVVFTIVMTRHTPDPQDLDEPLLAWFNAAAQEYQRGIAEMIEGLASFDWGLPDSRRRAARRLVRMWEQGGAAAFRDISAALPNRPTIMS